MWTNQGIHSIKILIHYIVCTYILLYRYILCSTGVPEHGVFGEEEGMAVGSGGHGASKWLWVLDPIDGTKSFITGKGAIDLCPEVAHLELRCVTDVYPTDGSKSLTDKTMIVLCP